LRAVDEVVVQRLFVSGSFRLIGVEHGRVVHGIHPS